MNNEDTPLSKALNYYLLTDKLRDGIRTNTKGMGKLIIRLTNFQIKPGFRLAKIL